MTIWNLSWHDLELLTLNNRLVTTLSRMHKRFLYVLWCILCITLPAFVNGVPRIAVSLKPNHEEAATAAAEPQEWSTTVKDLLKSRLYDTQAAQVKSQRSGKGARPCRSIIRIC